MAMFEVRKHIEGPQDLLSFPYIIANSQTVYANSMIYLDGDGFVIPATAGSLIAGVVMAIVNKDGIDLGNAATSTFDGTFTERDGTTPASYASSADNETDKQVKVLVCVSKNVLYKNDADGDLVQGDVFEFGNLVSSTQVDATDVGNAAYGQVQCLALDPDGEGNDSMGLFKIAESQLDPYAQQ